MTVSLALIGAVGLSEAYSGYALLHRQTVEANGKMVQHQIQRVLQGGVPLGQISNLAGMLQPLHAQPAIDRVAVLDADGALLVGAPSGTGADGARAAACEALRLPLQSRTGVAGTLVLCARATHVSDLVWSRFSWLIPVSVAAIALVSLLIHWLAARRGHRRALVRNLLHMAAFAAIVAAMLVTLIGIYSHGIKGKLEGLANALQARLEAPLALGIPLATFTGLEELLDEYRREDEQAIRSIVIMSGSEVLARTRESAGRPPAPELRDHDRITRSLAGEAPGQATPGAGLRIELWVSRAFLYVRLWAAIKNLLALTLALMLMARLFQSLVTSVETRLATSPAHAGHTRGHLAVAQAKPFFALVVLAEGLGASFLPRFFAAEAGEAMVSILVTAYFAAFALCLIPAGRYAEKHGEARLLHAGPVLIALGLLAMAWSRIPIALLIARVLCGAGQGMVFIGTQSFLLRATGGRGAEVLVTGFYVGLIAGTTLGALIMRYAGPGEVFMAAAAVVLLALLYARLLLHGLPRPDCAVTRERGSLRQFLRVLEDRQFLQAVFLAGLPSRLIYTGVFVLAIPLLLARLGYQADDIGQIMIFHAVGVLGISHLLTHLDTRGFPPERLLVIGLSVNGLGLVFLAVVADTSTVMGAGPRTVALVVSLMLLGGGYGLVGAPSLQYAVSAPAARVAGTAASAALCRLFERAGQALGPTLLGPLVLQAGAGTRVIGRIGLSIIGLGLLLFLVSRRSRPDNQKESAHA